MFTGIIETMGELIAIEREGDITHLRVRAPDVAEGLAIGDSVANNGVCLTVTSSAEGVMNFDAIQETLDKTSLGSLKVGDAINLERAMAADGRFGGHIVQGHVDTTGQVRTFEKQGDDVRLHIQTSEDFAELLVPKGSVTISGVSLTVVDVVKDGFDVALIPVTLRDTTLGALQIGDPVNLEADIIGKYVQRYLARMLPEARKA
ncbi:MAG: riboflavin synthase [Deltaproteobacteria bacterium]|nr:riboflavin synthase [Deltaproteobacteria bacterium]